MHYHIVGIAGAGMSAIANVLLDQGHKVSGSDRNSNHATLMLAARGATIYLGHDPAYIAGATALVATSAVKAEHPEVVAAQAAGIPVLRRHDLWQTWSAERAILAIAGTHGKTTTTALLAAILTAQHNLHQTPAPGFLIGSEAPDLGGNARWGALAGPLVIEADEYAHTFLALTPEIAVITNVEWDHPDIYPTESSYFAAFAQFVSQTKTLLICGDKAYSQLFKPEHSVCLTYGLDETSDYQGLISEQNANFTLRRSKAALQKSKSNLAATTTFQLLLPGHHNLRNALAAIAVADQLGVDKEAMTMALAHFHGTSRRFEIKGEAQGILVIDDYAHHPTEVQATLAAARANFPKQRIVAYLQPHTFSRTRALFAQWVTSFGNADLVFLGDVYGAREERADAEGNERLIFDLTENVQKVHSAVEYVGNLAQATARIKELLQPGDVFLTMSAGDGNQIGEQLLAALRAG